MASTYSTDLRLELIGTGEQQGAWGFTTNKNIGTLIEQAIAGGINKNITGLSTYTLTAYDGITDEARAAVLRFTGTLTGTCDIVAPSVSKQYIIRNDTTGGYPIQIKTATGAVIIVPAGESSIVACNGLDFYSALTCINDDARITGDLTVDGALSAASFTLASPLPVLSGGTGVTTSTGTTNVVLSNSPTLVTPDLGTPSALIGTNITGTAASFTAGTVTTNANLTGGVTSVGNAATVITNANLTGGVTSVGNAATVITNANLTGVITSVGNATSIASQTGTGSKFVVDTSPTLITPLLGTPNSGVMSNCTVDGTNLVGFRNVPFNSQSAAYTTVLADSGKVIFHPSTDATIRTFTIDSNANVPYIIGTAITFINMTTQVVTIAITSDTMYLSGAGTTGSRSLALYGSATAIKMTSTTWLISGTNLT
jgi:hypothetical protein